jgi:hypothetical protein
LRPLDYKFRLETASQLRVYREIGRLAYQCCEGDIPQKKRYRLLVGLKATVADSIIDDISEREKQMADELENSLYARWESCCKGVEHDDEHCGAPTTRPLLLGARR